ALDQKTRRHLRRVKIPRYARRRARDNASIEITQTTAGTASPAITRVGATPAAIKAPPTSGLAKAPMRATADAQPLPVARMLDGYSAAANDTIANCEPPVQAPITSSSAPQEKNPEGTIRNNSSDTVLIAKPMASVRSAPNRSMSQANDKPPSAPPSWLKA